MPYADAGWHGNCSTKDRRGTMKKFTMWLMLPLFACVFVLAAKVTTDYNHSTDFSRYKTYSWIKVEAGNPLWPDRIRGVIDSQLAAKGITQAPSQGDLSVAA